jgi:uncharacterized surface protein with fasciclin (FAS1) repeats
MKERLPVSCIIIILACIVIFPSCKKDTIPAAITSSTPLQAFINSDTSLSVFYTAIQKAGDNALYGGTDSVTVLAPTNAAFALQGVTVSAISSMSVMLLDSLLRYHFIPSSATLIAGVYTAYASKLGPAVYGYGNTDGSSNYFNGSLAILQNVPGSIATVYKLNMLLQVPAVSSAQLIASDTSLTYFAEAVKHTSLSLVPAGGWNTILAPVNSAFVAAGYATLASIDSTDAGALTTILQYHILPAQYFTNSFIGSASVGSSDGNYINLTFNNGVAQFTGTGNLNAASIITANRLAGAGTVIHTINGVLMP